MPNPKQVYWDACTWIAYIHQEMPGKNSTFTEARFDLCRETLMRAEAGEIEIATSAFTLAEVCKRSNATSPVGNLSAFFDQPYILLVPLDKQVGMKAQAIQSAGLAGLKPADAVHIASAIVWSIPVLHTFDVRLLKHNNALQVADGRLLEILRPMDEVPVPGLLEAMRR